MNLINVETFLSRIFVISNVTCSSGLAKWDIVKHQRWLNPVHFNNIANNACFAIGYFVYHWTFFQGLIFLTEHCHQSAG